MNSSRHYEPPASVTGSANKDVVAYVDRSTKGNWEDRQRCRSFPRSLGMLCGVLSIVMLWAGLSSMVLGLVMHTLGQPGDWVAVAVWGLFGFVFSLVCMLNISLTCKCPLCHGTPLHSRRCPKHRLADLWPPFTHRATTVLRVLTSLSFRCMYCGTPFRLFKKSSRLRQ